VGPLEVVVGVVTATVSFLLPVLFNRYPYPTPDGQHTELSLREINHVILIGALAILVNCALILCAFALTHDSWLFHATLLGCGFLVWFLSAFAIGLKARPRPLGQSWWLRRLVSPAGAPVREILLAALGEIRRLGEWSVGLWRPIWRRGLRGPTYLIRSRLRRIRNYRRRAL
jgi:hypothetical protein